MFENILTKENVTFKDFEEIAYKIACEFANEILRNMLEAYDKQVMDNRDTSVYRHKGKETTTIKAKTGLVEYTRTKYLTKNEEGKNKCVYLIDEMLNIKEKGQVSGGIIELIVKNIAEVSYRVCAEMINNMTGITISGVAVWNIVQQLGEEIKQYEKKKVEAFQEDKLKAGEKETPTVYQEADGIMIYTQGKDRKEQIEKYQKQCEKKGKEFKKPKSVKTELKLHVTYEGWKKDDERHPLVNKSYIAGMMSSKKLEKIRNARLYQKYDLEKVKLRVMNGDGARWIKNITAKGAISQKDNFHIHQEIVRDIPDKEYREELEKIIEEKRFDEVQKYIENVNVNRKMYNFDKTLMYNFD